MIGEDSCHWKILWNSSLCFLSPAQYVDRGIMPLNLQNLSRCGGGGGHWSLRALHITCNLQLGYPLSLSLFWQMSCLQEFHCSKTKLAEDTRPTGISIYIWTCWKQESRKSFCHGLDLHPILNVYAYMNMYVFLLLFFANKFRRKACTIFSTCNLWLPPQLPVTWFLTSLFRVLHDFLIAKSSSCFQFLISPGPWQAPPDLLRTPVLQAFALDFLC